MKYRREIDGLRALAVVPVVFFHAGFGAFGGGFVGVDIFFVISGYLITAIILGDHEKKRFSLVNFYERRARRILPALFFVILCTLPPAWFWLPTEDLLEYSQSIIAVTSFVSNIFFWSQSDYFATAAELKPLLHTWSLAVEEQYYIFFPLLIMLLWRIRKRWLFSTILIVMTGSFILSEWGAYKYPSLTFFFLPMRAWELGIGAVIAFFGMYAPDRTQWLTSNRVMNEVAGIVGLLGIAISITTFDQTTPFPSAYALLPTIGAGLIVFFSSQETLVGRLLGTRPMVGIGLTSYSVYLWHQPIYVFQRHSSPGETTLSILLLLAMLSLVLGYLSWRFVELPFRNKEKYSRGYIFKATLAGSIILLTVGTIGCINRGFENRLTVEQRMILAKKYSKADQAEFYRRGTCFLNPDQDYQSFTEECGSIQPGEALMVWGDSNAAALAYGLRTISKNLMQYTASGCPPVLGMDIPSRPFCRQTNDFVFNQVERQHPKTLLLHADWIIYDDPLLTKLKGTLESIVSNSPGTEIVVVGSVPQWPLKGLPKYMVANRVPLFQKSYLPLEGNKLEELRQRDSLIRKVAEQSGAEFASPLDEWCLNDKCLAVFDVGDDYALTAWDHGHLTKEGSTRLAKALQQKSTLIYKNR